MIANAYFDEVRGRLIGCEITDFKLAANSLLIYVRCYPGDATGHILWIEPTWQFRGPGAVLAGSRQA